MDHRRDPFLEDRKSGLTGFMLGLVLSVTVAGLLVGFGSFLSFVSLVSSNPHPMIATRNADAIVVLTGGKARLEAGMSLLQTKRGQRLLISGVNSSVDRGEIRKLVEASSLDKFDCCVDLDKSATDTIGNADETARWAANNGYKQIIVVTAGYHMPRALAEMSHAEPDIEWLAHPVFPDTVHLEDWWRRPGTTQLLLSEYLKYLAMQIRFRLEAL